MVDILTGTAFGSPRRMNHREDEPTLEFHSSVSSRARGLLALRAQNWRASVSPTPAKTPYINLTPSRFVFPMEDNEWDEVEFRITCDQSIFNLVKYICGINGSSASQFFRKDANGRIWGNASAQFEADVPATLRFSAVDGAFFNGSRFSVFDKVSGRKWTIGAYWQTSNAEWIGKLYYCTFRLSGEVTANFVPNPDGVSANFHDAITGRTCSYNIGSEPTRGEE